jgi:hypothetical protein
MHDLREMTWRVHTFLAILRSHPYGGMKSNAHLERETDPPGI